MIYRSYALVTLLMLAFCLHAQAQDKADLIQQINNTKGNEHVKIAGTNVYIILPEGFILTATGEAVFDFSYGTRIYVTQRQSPFNKGLKGREPTDNIIDQYPLKVNQYEGHYKCVREGSEFMKEILAFGNQNVTVMVYSLVPTNNPVMINKVRTAMRSVVLLDEKPADPSDDAIFKVDITNSNLKFARMINGMLIYTESGSMIAPHQAGLIVAFEYAQIGAPDKQEAISQKYISESLYYKDVKVRESKSITIDKMPGYEITAEGSSSETNEREIIYLVMLFAKEGAYVIFGTAEKQFEDNLRMFKRVVKTFHLKEKQQE